MGGTKIMGAVMIMMCVWLMTVEALDAQKILDTLCGAATYKEACKQSLQPEAKTRGATPQMMVEFGVKAALNEADKASKLTDNLLVQHKEAASAVKSCKHLLEQAKDRLQEAMSQVEDAKNFKDPTQVFDLRLRLSDVNTFAITCVDEAPPQLQQPLKDATAQVTELSVDMLDIVTVFNKALSLNLLPTLNRRLLADS